MPGLPEQRNLTSGNFPACPCHPQGHTTQPATAQLRTVHTVHQTETPRCNNCRHDKQLHLNPLLPYATSSLHVQLQQLPVIATTSDATVQCLPSTAYHCKDCHRDGIPATCSMVPQRHQALGLSCCTAALNTHSSTGMALLPLATSIMYCKAAGRSQKLTLGCCRCQHPHLLHEVRNC